MLEKDRKNKDNRHSAHRKFGSQIFEFCTHQWKKLKIFEEKNLGELYVQNVYCTKSDPKLAPSTNNNDKLKKEESKFKVTNTFL